MSRTNLRFFVIRSRQITVPTGFQNYKMKEDLQNFLLYLTSGRKIAKYVTIRPILFNTFGP